MSYEKTLLEERAQAAHAAREILDAAAADKRSLTEEEKVSVDRAFAEVDAKKAIIDDIRRADAADAEIRAAMESMPEAHESRGMETAVKSDEDILRSMNRGEISSFEFRDVSKSSTGAPVPTSFYGRIMELLRDTGPVLGLGNVITTTSGEALQVPRTNAYPTGSVTAEGGHYVESDPTFSAFISLGAFKQSVLFQTTKEMLEDSGVDILGYIAKAIGQGIGYNTNVDLTVGAGTTEPTGVVTAAGSALTSGTSGTFEYVDVVDLFYSLDPAVRSQPKFAFMGSTGAVKRLRKLTDTTGQPLWQPAVVAGQPDMLLGKRIVENVAMADIGAGALPLVAGDFDSFLIRQVGGLRIERSDDFAFDYDLTTWKASLRIDSNLPQASHIRYLRCAL